ncbi:MAG: DUF1553 domain-containing protein [Verrucomicrobiota bacterium]|nr:DUF1553 domain-containing protein [Verrucomicrobiota bacterium]
MISFWHSGLAIFFVAGVFSAPSLCQASDSKDHWAFGPVKRPLIIGDLKPIDDLVEKKLRANGLIHSQVADRLTLVRRLYLVMHGLPPTPEQVEEFINDSAPDAFTRLVEKVLASQRYGERWASHWLDLVRFGETTGFETNRERPNAWHYRDWVIDSLNFDKPYDQFIREQLAGDALGEGIGTGFLVAGPNDIVKGQDPKLGKMQRMNELDDMINATGTTFLGLTTGCARCHDHKFDPISQKDYYSLQAIFAGVSHGDRPLELSETIKREIEQSKAEIARLKVSLSKFIPKSLEALREPVSSRYNVENFQAQEAKIVRFNIERTNSSQPCIDELEIFSGKDNIALASLGAIATSSGDYVHPFHKLEHINDGLYGNSKSWIAAGATGWVQIEFPKVKLIDRIEWARDREGQFNDRLAVKYRIEVALDSSKWIQLASSSDRKSYQKNKTGKELYEFLKFPQNQAKQGQKMLLRLEEIEKRLVALQNQNKVYAGSFTQPEATYLLYRGDPDAKRDQVSPDAISAFTSLELTSSEPEQHRRLALADWIASPDNPLTARVLVNRLWQFHFGDGIVGTPSDFGVNGMSPTHPQLLDWLAVEFMENDWSIKHIHRLILNSKTWQQSSRPKLDAMKLDATSRLLWRYPTRRLAAESIRDSVVMVSGLLNLKSGGPGFNGFQVQMENVRHFFPKKSYGFPDWRRMIYMTKVRQEQESVFGVFDCPDASQSVPKRSRSTTPLQALNLLNSTFLMQQADLFSDRLKKDVGSNPVDQVNRAFSLCFNRFPTPAEVQNASLFIESEGLSQFARALLNTNEFVFIP